MEQAFGSCKQCLLQNLSCIGSKGYVCGGGYLVVSFLLLLIGVFLAQFFDTVNYFYYQHALISVFWIAVGHYLHEHASIYEASLKWCAAIYPLIAVMALYKSTCLVADLNISVKTIPLHLLYSYTGTMFILKISNIIDNNNMLEFWGKNSLVVYGLHFTPLLILTETLWTWLMPDNWISFLCFFFLLYILEYMICWLLMKAFTYRPLKYLIGKF